MDEDQSIIIVGNPIDGYTFFGPFETSDDAVEWAEKNCHHQIWWVAGIKEAE